MILKTHAERKLAASADVPVRKSKIPFMIKLLLLSPGCTRAERKIPLRAASSSGVPFAVIVSRWQAFPARVWHNTSQLNTNCEAPLSCLLFKYLVRSVKVYGKQCAKTHLSPSCGNSTAKLSVKSGRPFRLLPFFTYFTSFPTRCHPLPSRLKACDEKNSGCCPAPYRLSGLFRLVMWKWYVHPPTALPTENKYHWVCPVVAWSGCSKSSYSNAPIRCAESKFPLSNAESNASESGNSLDTPVAPSPYTRIGLDHTVSASTDWTGKQNCLL
mmetsp:Transcript_10948/g.26311  ORF Transcript_10948/g.26311 Transcript_10948/m.26311 type:complete len:271 (-) Transcript_10948:878-1690(-)|eukprot:2712372-Rhodomonas_salina.1